MIRAGLAERRDRSEYYARVNCAQNVMVKLQLGHTAWGKGLNYDVSFGNKLLEELSAVTCLYIKGNSLFIHVVGEPIEAFLGVGIIMVERTQPAAGVATWSLNFDDICTQVG
jgi:aspartate ammonia-lyase